MQKPLFFSKKSHFRHFQAANKTNSDAFFIDSTEFRESSPKTGNTGTPKIGRRKKAPKISRASMFEFLEETFQTAQKKDLRVSEAFPFRDSFCSNLSYDADRLHLAREAILQEVNSGGLHIV